LAVYKTAATAYYRRPDVMRIMSLYYMKHYRSAGFAICRGGTAL
jgi:hypothetical protein